jgi:hypothetical protein
MRGIVLVLILWLAEAAISQTTTPPQTLSDPIQLQLRALAQEMSQVQRDFITVDQQVRKENPGWHLSQQLQVEQDPPAKQALPVPPPAPAKK